MLGGYQEILTSAARKKMKTLASMFLSIADKPAKSVLVKMILHSVLINSTKIVCGSVRTKMFVVESQAPSKIVERHVELLLLVVWTMLSTLF